MRELNLMGGKRQAVREPAQCLAEYRRTAGRRERCSRADDAHSVLGFLLYAAGDARGLGIEPAGYR